MSDQPSIRFGDGFELDLRAGRLQRSGRRVRLERIPLQVLQLLIERRGQLVTRQEIVERIWGSGVSLDTDNGINGAIRKIRRVLRDNTKEPRFIETVTGDGYIFIGQVDDQPQVALDQAAAARPLDAPSLVASPEAPQPLMRTLESPEAKPQSTPAPPQRVRAVAAAVALTTILVSVAAAYGVLVRVPDARVIGFVQPAVSNRAEPWHSLVTDGSRVYFLERAGDGWNVMRSSGAAIGVSQLEVPFRNTRILDISRDRSEFLIGSFASPAPGMPLWIWPAQGSPIRVGDMQVDDAVWSPDGRGVVYSRHSDIRVIQRDGTGDRLLVRTSGRASGMRWSPDRRRFSYTVGDSGSGQHSLWEADADGSNARIRIAPDSPSHSVCCGSWTADGRYFLYSVGRNRIFNLWAVPVRRSFLGWRTHRAVQLTTGTSSVYGSVSTATGNRIFAFVDGNQFESVKYDPASGHYVPFLRDIQAVDVQLAPGGTMVAFQRMPDGSLWRSNVDGAQRVQLVGAPLRVSHPRWSPDATMIAFEGRIAGRQLRAYAVSAEGGASQEILPAQVGMQSLPAWSPDGGSIALALNAIPADAPSTPRGIFIVDWKTRNATRLPGSDGLTAPLWSPDGKYLIATAIDARRIVRFDSGTGQWIEIVTGNRLSGPTWSGDSSVLYVQDTLDPGGPVYRYRVPEFRRERVFTVEPLLSRGIQACAFRGWAPDGWALIQLTRVGPQIFAIDVDLP